MSLASERIGACISCAIATDTMREPALGLVGAVGQTDERAEDDRMPKPTVTAGAGTARR